MKTVCAWKLPSKTALYQWTFMRPKRCGGEKEKTLLDEDATMGLQHIDADNTLDPQHMPGVDKELFDARLKGGYSKQIRWKYHPPMHCALNADEQLNLRGQVRLHAQMAALC